MFGGLRLQGCVISSGAQQPRRIDGVCSFAAYCVGKKRKGR